MPHCNDAPALAAARKPPRVRFDVAADHAEALFAGLDLAASGGPPALLAAHERAVAAALREARRRGLDLPLHDFLRSARLDPVDRALLLALLRAGLEGKRGGGVRLADLAVATRSTTLAGRLALRTRLEEGSALRALALLESDADLDLDSRSYRLAPDAVSRLVPGGRPEALEQARPQSPEQALSSAFGAAANLARLPELLARGGCWWSTALPGAAGWDRFGVARGDLAREAARLSTHSSGPFARTVAEAGLEGPESLVLLLLAEAAVSRGGGLSAALLADAAFPAGSEGDAALALGPSGRLARAGLVAVPDAEAPLFCRTLALAAAARGRLRLPPHAADASKSAEAEESGPLLERSAPAHRLSDVVLAPEARGRVDDLLFRLGDGGALLRGWGLAAAAGGAAVLLHGAPGTGKTFTAEALAAELGRPLARLRVDAVLSRWVGVSEQRVAAAFREAAAERAVLLLDEADALLVDRAGARPWQVPLVNVLLVEIERFSGLVVLATNRADSLDPALERRLALRLELLPPGEAERAELWRRHLPPGAPLAADVDLAALARGHALTGSGIRRAAAKAALRAARRPAAARRITQADLVAAAAEDAAAPSRPLGFRAVEAPRPEPRKLFAAA